jgi:opacity protein-like surface antigen
MSMNGKSLAAALLFSTLAWSAQAQKPAIQWNKDYDFNAVETFAWQDTPDTSLETQNPFMHSLIKNTLEAELAESGLTEVDANPDVYVNYHASSTTEVQLRSDSYGYGFGGYGMGGWGYYGMGSVGTVSTTTRAVEYQRGTLVVDIWDAAKKELVWRGEVTDTLPDNPQKAEKLVVKAIGKMTDQGRKLWAQELERREKAARD